MNETVCVCVSGLVVVGETVCQEELGLKKKQSVRLGRDFRRQSRPQILQWPKDYER